MLLERLLGNALGSSKSQHQIDAAKQDKRDYAQAKRLSKKLGITIEIDREFGQSNYYYVKYDGWDESKGQNGYAYSWSDCHDKLLEIQAEHTQA